MPHALLRASACHALPLPPPFPLPPPSPPGALLLPACAVPCYKSQGRLDGGSKYISGAGSTTLPSMPSMATSTKAAPSHLRPPLPPILLLLPAVTLLAVGNAAPDLSASILAMSQNQITLSLGAMVGECVCGGGVVPRGHGR